MNESYINGIFALAGAIIGGGLTAWGMFAAASRTAKIEEKKHNRELGLRIATTKFEHRMKLAKDYANITGQSQFVPPFESFVIDGMKLVEIASTPNLSADEVAIRMGKLQDFTATIIAAALKKAAETAAE